MTNKKEEDLLIELKKEIIIERLRQAPPTVKVSFGMSDGRFLSRDELINEINKDTEIGRRVVNVQLAYLKAFKKGLFVKE